MAAVTGKTSIKIDDLINDTIVDGEIVGNHLILRSRGGAEIDAGVISGMSISVLATMPVGYVYISVDSTTPATLFGGTWIRIAEGRVLVGQDPSQTEFDVAEETGGENTVVLTPGQMPSHTHTFERKTAAGTSTGVARGGVTVTADGTTISGGGINGAHNNLQPYLVVYMWKRVS